ncbi:MAG: four helix bundle protein [Bacteroidales bacterium]|jgi:four helix bundle protein|nr:four helix bundle protein [Bacteroidales bacterium]
MKTIKFEDLKCWQLARELCKIVFQQTKKYEYSRDFEHVNQIRASSGSVMDNIAEGFERGGNKEFIQFLFIAKSSNAEVRSQLHRAFDNNYITQEDFKAAYHQSIQAKIAISSLIKSLKNNISGGMKNWE